MAAGAPTTTRCPSSPETVALTSCSIETTSPTPISVAPSPTGRYGFILSDLTGDGLLDDVLQTDSCLSPTLGHGVWWVYLGDGAGFSDSAIPYTLPAAVSDHGSDDLGFFGTSGDMDSDLAGGEAAWTLLDLSADGLLDLVFHYDDCVDSDMGVTYWDVYRDAPTGFEDGAQRRRRLGPRPPR